MDAKHTPGPWRVGASGEVFDTSGYSVVDPGQGPHLSEGFLTGPGDTHWASTPGAEVERSDEECLANARLIAAAPEMFEALLGWVEWLDADYSIYPDNGPEIEAALLAKARAALAKARGQ